MIFVGPAHWHGDCNLPDKISQSPINIVTTDAKYNYFGSFNFQGYVGVDGVLSNNGHTG